MSDRRPSSPIAFSDDELEAILAAARPLDVHVRDEFLQRVAGALRDCVEIGPGTVHRTENPMRISGPDPPSSGGSGAALMPVHDTTPDRFDPPKHHNRTTSPPLDIRSGPVRRFGAPV
jgi:hypothetical protein